MERVPVEILCCPVTRQPLRDASPVELNAFDPVLTAGLIREDGMAVYPFSNSIPLLVPDAAISRKP